MFITDNFLQAVISDGAVLLAAAIGFWGVIYSQRKLARMSEEARIHESQMAKAQTEADRKHEFSSLLSALLGELSALDVIIGSAQSLLEAQTGLAKETARQSQGTKLKPRVSFQFSTPVFDSHVGRIGLLGPALAFEVASFFGKLRALSGQSNDHVPEMEPALAVRIMQSVADNLHQLKSEASALAARLQTKMQVE